MAKQAQYVRRPCKSLDSSALWDWLETEHPELITRFIIAFNYEASGCLWETDPHYPELREHIEKFVKCK